VPDTRRQLDGRVVRPDEPQRRLTVIGHREAEGTTLADVHVSVPQHIRLARYTTNVHTLMNALLAEAAEGNEK